MKVFGLLISAVFLVSFVSGQTSDGTCGPTGKNQNCGTSYCCSQYGYCGTTTAYCGAGCQPLYGKCNSGTTTSSTTTSSSTSTSTSTTPTSTTSAPPTSTTKAVEVTKCKVTNTTAITFDDGPSQFTHTLLDKLLVNKYKATFFINGNNYGCIYDYADIIKRAMSEGHQIASHTWSHPDLATLTEAQITTEMKKLEDALIKITGKKPVYMRPPFGSGVNSNTVMTTLGKLGYKVITWDLDTNDWQGVSTTTALNVYKNAAGPPATHIALNHDTVQNTAENMGPQAFDVMKGRGFKLTTVGECLGDTDPNSWYIKVGDPKPRDSTWVC